MGILCSRVTIHVLGKLPIFLMKTSQFFSFAQVCACELCLLIHLFTIPSICESMLCCVCMCVSVSAPSSSSFLFPIWNILLFLRFPQLTSVRSKPPRVKLLNQRGNSRYFWLTTAADPSLFRVQVLKAVITTPTT
jgi:hypothetical protein